VDFNLYRFLSKFVWISLLKNKNAASVRNGLIDVFNRCTGRQPEKIQTDEGNEFKNQVFKAKVFKGI
jgi:hypothetical protein